VLAACGGDAPPPKAPLKVTFATETFTAASCTVEAPAGWRKGPALMGDLVCKFDLRGPGEAVLYVFAATDDPPEQQLETLLGLEPPHRPFIHAADALCLETGDEVACVDPRHGAAAHLEHGAGIDGVSITAHAVASATGF
jgi:hypothetical protein